MRIAMVAGEASGDLLAAHLIEALKSRHPSAEFCGIGGPKMERAGFSAWWPAEKLAVRGYVEVLKHYREIARIRRQLLARLRAEKPDVFIGVDAPDFNLWLERKLKNSGIRTVHYVSPSVWAWRGGRVKKIARACDRLLALFPFEPPLYAKTGLPVSYVGHPLADAIPLDIDRPAARLRLEIPPSAGPLFALLPGSRQSELQYMAETFVRTAGLLRERYPQAQFLVPLVSRETRNQFETACWQVGAQEWPIKMLFGHAQEALAACDVALVASGTATLEAALMKAPMVIAYRMAPLSWQLMKRMRYQPWVGLPNILAEAFVAPELLQDQATPEQLANALADLAGDVDRQAEMREKFREIHLQLRCNTAEKAAAAIAELLPACA